MTAPEHDSSPSPRFPGANQEVYVPPGGPPQGVSPSKKIYGAMGEENIYAMCRDFYKELAESEIRHLFPDDMEEASRRNAAFFVGLTGGPPRYRELYGNPMMRRRHLHLPIDERARLVWVGCFKKTLEHAPARYGFPEEHLPGFIRFLEAFSKWMVNRKSP